MAAVARKNDGSGAARRVQSPRVMRCFVLASVVSSLLAAACAVGCSSANDVTARDEADHTARAPVFANDTHFWAETDYVTFKSIAQAPPFNVGQPLPPSTIVTQRLQAWADRIHEAVKADVLASSGKELVAPRPLIVVVPAKEANAWVSGVPSCVSGDADLSSVGSRGRAPRTASLVFLEHARLKEAWSMFGAPPPSCARPENWKDQDALLSFLGASGSRCKVEPAGGEEGDRVKVSGEGCALDGQTAPTTARRLTYYATSPYIHFTSAMIALAEDEHAIVGIVAHELGHFYRAHAVSDLVMGKYNHWYEQKDTPDTIEPAPTPDSAALEATFRRVAPYPMAQVPGQKLSYRIGDFLADSLGSLLQRAGLCGEATALLDDGWRYSFSGFSGGYVDARTREKYLAYERALLTCAEVVAVTESGGSGALALADVRDALARGAHAFAEPAVTGATLSEILAVVHGRAAVLDDEARAFHATLRDRRLGRWTAEQEADDFSVEYFARVGLDPEKRIASYLELIAAHYAGDDDRFMARNGGLDLATCRALHRDGFRTDGRPASVPLGDLHDPHHGDCYRLFNMSQELRAHGFRATGSPPALTGTWDAARDEAKRATDELVPLRPHGGMGGPSHLPRPASGGPSAGTIVDGL